ncbi:hypothetical protein pEaSNUABM11_00248 [Erwinia phage pEa_SNUABM_11]|nr:hypothetical protein pEaSNUABM11_00248 [Erwinia phage pEa_SNUABM_11]
MQYQRVIIQRLEQGLRAIDPIAADALVAQFAPPADSLGSFCPQVVSFYQQLLRNRNIPDVWGYPSVPENGEAIAYWIEDLENTTLPHLRLAAKLQTAS